MTAAVVKPGEEAQRSNESSSDYKSYEDKHKDDDDDCSESGTKEPIQRRMRVFFALTRMYFVESSQGRWMFLGLVLLMILNSAVRVFFSFLGRDFWSALGDQDAEKFYKILKQFLIALLVLAPINVLYGFHQQRLAIKWRKWMTHRLLHLYYSNRVYYTLESSSQPKLDNPDQRIAEDVRSFTQYSLSLFLTFAVSLIDLACFSIILYSIEPMLFFSIIGFAGVGTLATVLLGKKLVRLNFDRLQKEADFRYSLVRIRDNAESIAFFRGEQIESSEVRRRFSSVLANAYDIIGTQRNLEFFTTPYNYLTWILPVVVIAPKYFDGSVELGVVQQAAAAFGHVLDDLSIIINKFESLSEFSASIGRLNQFVRAVQNADPDRSEKSPLLSNDQEVDGLMKQVSIPVEKDVESPYREFSGETVDQRNAIKLREMAPLVVDSNRNAVYTGSPLFIHNLTLSTPDLERTLILSLNLELRWGQSLLIVGPSGVGKSSLLRAIAGLWTSGSGVIERASFSDIYFLPQRPYCPLGSLRNQLLYPSCSYETASEVLSDEADPVYMPQTAECVKNDEQLLEVLSSVDLYDLAVRAGHGDPMKGLNCEMDWSHTLSLGEQQRLAFGRILVNKPKMVIMDESTSALDVASETKMYSLLKGLGKSITYISVGHRPTLLPHHGMRLYLSSVDNNYTLDQISSTEESVATSEVNQFYG